MSRRFLANTYSSDENFNGDCDYADIRIYPVIAQQILERRDAFLAQRKRDSQLVESYFWDASAIFCKRLDNMPIPGKKADLLAAGYPVRIAQSADLPCERQNVECNQMVIGEDGVKWTAIPKHTSVVITTERIAYSEIEKEAKRFGGM
jgi:hypothetical protein